MPIHHAVSLNHLWHSSQPEIGNAGQGCIAFGAFFKNVFYAIAIWGQPLARKFNDKGFYELRRMAIASDAPKNTGSRMLRVMRLLLKKQFPDIKRLISYQDIARHNGPLYASAGWVGTEVNIPASGWESRYRDKSKANPDVSRSVKIRWEYSLDD